jgi:hypothetical protein
MIQKIPEEFQDFRTFLWYVWHHLNLPEPTSIQYDIANFLQNNVRRKVIEAFRGVGKSWITSAFVVWMLRIDQQLNFLVVSASKQRSDDFSTFTLRLINELPVLQPLIPRSDQRTSKIAFDVNGAEADHAPSVKSVGITGQLTGSRADYIIADDIEVVNNSCTQPLRDKLSESIKEFDSIIKPEGKIIFLGTPQTEQSIYNLLPSRGFQARIWPARYPEGLVLNNYGEKLSPLIRKEVERNPKLVGKTTDPMRFTDLDLMEREGSQGRSGFALQYMLDTSLSDRDKHPLKLRDLIIMSVDHETGPEKVVWSTDMDKIIKDLPNVGLPGDNFYAPLRYQGDFIPYEASVMVIDPSGRGEDETSYAVGKMLNSQIFVLEAGGMTGGYEEETLRALVTIAKRNKVNEVIIESNFGDGMFKALIEPYFTKIYPVAVEEVRHNIQKEKRIIDTLEPVMNQHKLIIDKSVIEKDFETNQEYPSEKALKYMLFYQLSHITRIKGSLGHDDRLDALSMLVGYFVEMMDRDTDKMIEKRKAQLMHEELAVFEGRRGKFGLSVVVRGDKLISKNRYNRRPTWFNTRGVL